jgi:hypothetical protein
MPCSPLWPPRASRHPFNSKHSWFILLSIRFFLSRIDLQARRAVHFFIQFVHYCFKDNWSHFKSSIVCQEAARSENTRLWVIQRMIIRSIGSMQHDCPAEIKRLKDYGVMEFRADAVTNWRCDKVRPMIKPAKQSEWTVLASDHSRSDLEHGPFCESHFPTHCFVSISFGTIIHLIF